MCLLGFDIDTAVDLLLRLQAAAHPAPTESVVPIAQRCQDDADPGPPPALLTRKSQSLAEVSRRRSRLKRHAREGAEGMRAGKAPERNGYIGTKGGFESVVVGFSYSPVVRGVRGQKSLKYAPFLRLRRLAFSGR